MHKRWKAEAAMCVKREAKVAALRGEKTTDSRKELRRMNDSFVRPERTSVKLVKQQMAGFPLFSSHL